MYTDASGLADFKNTSIYSGPNREVFTLKTEGPHREFQTLKAPGIGANREFQDLI